MRTLIFLLSTTLLLMACTKNNIQTNYQSTQELTNKIQKCTTPKIVHISATENLEQAQKELQGYVFIGKAMWTDKGTESNNHALEQGKNVGACLVLWQKKHVGTIHTKKRISRPYSTKARLFTIDTLLSDSSAPFFNYEEVPVTYQYLRHTVLFFAKKNNGQ